ncbi:MAG TPA: hypothetical protein VIN60_11325 [Anaerolineales bacterium]
MMKKTLSLIGLVVLTILLAGGLTAAAPTPNVTFTLVSGLPATMNVGDTATVVVQVTSDQQFNFAQMLPNFQYPGKGVMAVQGGDHVGAGTTAKLQITFVAKSSTASKFPGGVAPVSVVAGARYQGGYVVSQQFDFNVAVP